MEIRIFHVAKLELWCGLVSFGGCTWRGKFFTWEPSEDLVIELLVEKDDVKPVSREEPGG